MTCPIRVVIFGGRDLDPIKVRNWLIANARHRIAEHLGVLACEFTYEAIIEGGMTGADHGAELFEATLPGRTEGRHMQFKADWNRYGRSAGPKRNRQMIRDALPDLGIAFPGHDGTADMLSAMNDAGIPVLRIEGDFK